MRQLLHIFKKDLRRLWPLALICWSMVALHASHRWLLLAHLLNAPLKVVMGTEMFAGLTPLFWWFLLVFLIHQEPLCGDRQFWITRPYSRWSLLGAKLLFVAVAIQIPVLLSDAFLLSSAGFPPLLSTLLVRNLYISVVVLLPVAAFAMVTSGIGQVIATGLAFVAGMILWVNYTVMFGLGRYEGLEWMLQVTAAILLLAAGGTVAVLQYRFRKTTHSRAIVLGAALILAVVAHLFPWSKAFALQAALTGGGPRPEIQIALDRNGAKSGVQRRATHSTYEFVEIHLPVRIEGLAQSMELVSDGVKLTVIASGGQHWEYGPTSNMSLMRSASSTWMRLHLDNRFYQRFRSTPVNVSLSMDATVFRNHHTATVPAGTWSFVPGVGQCASDVSRVACVGPTGTLGRIETVWRNRETGVMSAPEEVRSRGGYVSLPLVSWLNPIPNGAFTISNIDPQNLAATDIVYTVKYPVAHIQRELKIDGFRMEEFRIP